jgi:hypothetical protein
MSDTGGMPDAAADDLKTTPANEVGEQAEIVEGKGREASTMPLTYDANVDGTPVKAPEGRTAD